METNKDLVQSIQDKHVEVHYNDKRIRVGNRDIHIEMQGKITCTVLNSKVSSLTCSKLMEQDGWPREVDECVCDNARCKIYKSIQKNMASRSDRPRKNS